MTQAEVKLGIVISSDLNRRIICSKDCLDFSLLGGKLGRSHEGRKGAKERERHKEGERQTENASC